MRHDDQCEGKGAVERQQPGDRHLPAAEPQIGMCARPDQEDVVDLLVRRKTQIDRSERHDQHAGRRGACRCSRRTCRDRHGIPVASGAQIEDQPDRERDPRRADSVGRAGKHLEPAAHQRPADHASVEKAEIGGVGAPPLALVVEQQPDLRRQIALEQPGADRERDQSEQEAALAEHQRQAEQHPRPAARHHQPPAPDEIAEQPAERDRQIDQRIGIAIELRGEPGARHRPEQQRARLADRRGADHAREVAREDVIDQDQHEQRFDAGHREAFPELHHRQREEAWVQQSAVVRYAIAHRADPRSTRALGGLRNTVMTVGRFAAVTPGGERRRRAR